MLAPTPLMVHIELQQALDYMTAVLRARQKLRGRAAK